MPERFQWQEEHSSFKIPQSSAISDGLEAFMAASGRTPSRLKTYLVLDARTEIFMDHNR